MNETEFHFCLWHQLPWLKSNQKRALFQHFSDPFKAYRASRSELEHLGLGAASVKRWQAFSQNPLDAVESAQLIHNKHVLEGVHFIHIGDPRYPSLLAEIDKPPEALYVKGNVTALEIPSIAIVGSRRCTRAAEDHAVRFAKALAASGFSVVSGGALGIDAAAHRGAIGAGATVAVMATGIDQCYPKSHQRLYQEVIENGGAVITEFSPFVVAKAGHFPKRNRIITGMSLGTLVVEAAMRSGSLISARLANEYGREVFAIPGAIDNVMAKGCNYLIKNGAKLTEDVHDIAEEFKDLTFTQPIQSSDDTAPISSKVNPTLEAIDFAYTAVDTIATRLDLPIHELLPELLTLELAGAIANEGGGYTRLK